MRLSVRPLAPGTKPYDVVGVGLNSVDLLVVVRAQPLLNTKQRAEQFAIRPGGQTATAMVTCSRLGWRARYIGRFGGDAHGSLCRASLRESGVDVSACETVDGATNQFAVIVVEQGSGNRTIMWGRHPGLHMTPADVPADAVTSGRVVLVDCHETAAATQAARLARQAGIPTVIDVERVRPGMRDLLREVDVIIAAQEFPTDLTGERSLGKALHLMAGEFGAALVAVTLGAEGSVAIVGGQEVRTPGLRVDVVDTTGAGDVFRGGFIAAWLAAAPDADAADLLRSANVVAALNCRALGAQGGIPEQAEVDAVLARE